MVSFKSPITDLLNTSFMISILLRRHFRMSVVLLFILISSVGYSQKICNNDLQLNSKINNDTERSIEVSIVTTGIYSCTILHFVNGEYLNLIEKSGSGDSIVKFESLDAGDTYKVIAVFENASGLCRTRQLGGISL